MPDCSEARLRRRRDERTIAGRLIETLIREHVDIEPIAKLARVSLTDLCGCACGLHRLKPDDQLRLAAAIAGYAPLFASRAHALYAQAQTELRLLAGEAERPVNGPFGRSQAIVTRAEQAGAVSDELLQDAKRLRSIARALCAANADIRSKVAATLRDEVVHFATVAKQHGESPDATLALVRTAVEPLFTDTREDATRIVKQLVDWCVDAYYAA